MKKILVTEKEEELIEAIRNFRKSYPKVTHSYYGTLSSCLMR